LALAATFVLPLGIVLWFRDELLVSIANTPDGAHRILSLGWPGNVLHLVVLLASVFVLMNLERTFRASVGTMRWRIKFIVLAVGTLFAARIYTTSQFLLYRQIDLASVGIDAGALLVASVLVLRSLFRPGHFDTAVYPSHSLIHGSLTILLTGVYLLVIGVFAKVVTYLGGDAAFPLKALVVLVGLVSLTVLLQSDRVRLYTRRFVGRHFHRSLYDYRTVWMQFAESTAKRMDVSDLCGAIVRLVADIFQALSVSVWVLDEKHQDLKLVASTSITPGSGQEQRLHGPAAEEVLHYFQDHFEPVEIETPKEGWSDELRRCHPSQFANGGKRHCVPIVGRGEVLGLIIVGDRVAGAAFGSQELDMLKCVADHVATSLLNVELSRNLLQAREFEAFQTMATFFVHDLKNAASTLNLMLQNLPGNFDDPAFREDALRGIAKTVNHINHLTGRLGHLRDERKIQLVEADLNEVIARATSGWSGGPTIKCMSNLRALPELLLDPDQMLKVVTNLVLNATEALAGNGQIEISTAHEQRWVCLTVSDTGCGMTPEFVARSLFRPFQTTKKGGLGIGMFQSKMIVEAHGGRIAVESEPGKGTTFRIYLPVAHEPQKPATSPELPVSSAR
jgi:putative PEP-CTERM system histidine kinase